MTHGQRNTVFLTTLKSAIINAGQIIVQAEDGEIDGVVKEDEILLFDNVEGGVGYVDAIYDNFEKVMKMAAEMVLEEAAIFGEACSHGCPRCLWSYRRNRDIAYTDKQTILPFLDACKKAAEVRIDQMQIFEKREQNMRISNIRTIYSPAYSFDGVLELRNLLRTTNREIKLTSLYVTDDRLDWPDGEEKSWVDILSSIYHSKRDISITIIVREPKAISHKRALRRLKENGINVKIYKKEFKNDLTSIVHSKLVVIDPLDTSNRCAVHTSGNFSAEMVKNHDTFDISSSEKWVNRTYEEIQKLEKESADVTDLELIITEGIQKIAIRPGANLVELYNKVGKEIGKAISEISIMDPYLGKIDKVFEFLFKWLRQDIEVRIVTAYVDSKEISKAKEKYSLLGYKK